MLFCSQSRCDVLNYVMFPNSKIVMTNCLLNNLFTVLLATQAILYHKCMNINNLKKIGTRPACFELRERWLCQIWWIFGKVPKGGGGSEVPFSNCVLFWFFSIVKKHTLKPKITLLNKCPALKVLFKVSKFCNIIFWIENDRPPPHPTPLWNFSEN